MDSWNQEGNHDGKNDQDVTVSGRFNSDGQDAAYRQDAYGRQNNDQQIDYSQNGWQQNSYGQNDYQQNSYQQNIYGQSQGNAGGYGQPQNNGGYGQSQNNGWGYGQPQNNAGGYGQPYTGYNQSPYQGSSYSPVEKEEPVGMGEWAGLLALASFVPCIGIILVIVWAFGKTEKKSKSNFCKAYLIIWLIKLAVAMILFIVYGAALAAVIGRF